MINKIWYQLTPVGKYVNENISKTDLVETLKTANPDELLQYKRISEMLYESKELVGDAYLSNIQTKRKSLIWALTPPLIAGALGLLGKACGFLPNYESTAYLAGMIGSVSLPLSYISYLGSESTSYSRKTKKAARIVVKHILKRKEEFPSLAYDIENGRLEVSSGSPG